MEDKEMSTLEETDYSISSGSSQILSQPSGPIKIVMVFVAGTYNYCFGSIERKYRWLL